MEFTFKTQVNAPQDKIWQYYTNPAKRAVWEEDLEQITFDGDLKTGTTGKLKLRDLPEMQFQLTNIIENQAYWDRTDIPGLGSIYFGHDILTEEGKTFIRHTLQMHDPEGKHFEFLSGIYADVPESVMKLKKAVEQA